MKHFAIAFVIGVAAAASTGRAEGSVSVSFIDEAKFVDAGAHPAERATNLATLSRHLQQLAQALPTGQVLTVEVIDLDLAGKLEPARGALDEVRVLKGLGDWPSITLRYALRADGRTIASGTERLRDLDYLRHARSARRDEALHYERRLLEIWFRERFGADAPAH